MILLNDELIVIIMKTSLLRSCDRWMIRPRHT